MGIFKRKGVTRKQSRAEDFAMAKGAIQKGEKLSERDKRMIAVGRTQIHVQNSDDYKYRLEKKKKSDDGSLYDSRLY